MLLGIVIKVIMKFLALWIATLVLPQMDHVLKNLAYRRQSISLPMQIVAPIPKNPTRKANFTKEKKMRGDFLRFISKSFTM